MKTTTTTITPAHNADRPRLRGRRALKALGAAAAFGAGCLLCLSAAGADASGEGPAIVAPPPDSADPNAPFVSESNAHATPLLVLINKSAVLETKTPYKRVNVGQPDIADVNLLGPGKILVTGKKAGATQLIVWDDGDRAQVLDVSVQVDAQGLSDQVKRLYPGLKIDVSASNGDVILRGRVPSIDTAAQIVAVSKPYGAVTHDFLEVSGGQQVMLSVKFAEVSRAATDALGVNTGLTDGKSFFGNNIGGINPFGTKDGPNNSGQVITSPTPGAAVTLFGQGMVGRAAFQYFVQALRENSMLRVLAEPNLIAVSGQEASFLAGGTIPIPVSQGGAGGGAVISIVEREYGVKLKFVPVVLGDGRIRLKVSPEVSDLDYANGVTLNGFVIPGMTERKVTTTIELADGQSFAIAGLLNTSVATNKDVTPLLGDLPVIGPVFRTVRYAKKETEMVVLVTPHLVEPMNPADLPPLPGEQWREPTENELFWKQDLGGPVADAAARPGQGGQPPRPHRTPMFHGQYGFQQVGPVAPDVPPAPAALANTGRD